MRKTLQERVARMFRNAGVIAAAIVSALLYSNDIAAQRLQITKTDYFCNDHEETFRAISDVIRTADGGYCFVGLTKDSGGGILPPCQPSNISTGIMGKLDSTGKLEWLRHQCNTMYTPSSVCQTSDGGYASNSGDIDTAVGMIITRYDRDGNMVWKKNYGANARSASYQVLNTFDHGFLVVGVSESIDQDIPSNYQWPPIQFQPIDWVLMKLDSLGNKQWVRMLGTSGMESDMQVIAIDSNFYLIGGTESKDHDCADTTNYPGLALYAIKVSNSGQLLWSRAFSFAAFVSKVLYDSRDQSILITGRCPGNGRNLTGGNGKDDAFLIKIDTAANYRWGKLFGTQHSDIANSIVPLPDDNYLVMGHSIDLSFGWQGLLAVLSKNGELQYQKSVLTNGDGGVSFVGAFSRQLGVDLFGHCYGLSLPEGTGSNCSYNGLGSGGLSVSRTTYLRVGVPDAENPKPSFSVFPNPARERIIVETDVMMKGKQIVCTGSGGTTVYSSVFQGNRQEISTGSWPGGCYYIRLIVPGQPDVVQKVSIK